LYQYKSQEAAMPRSVTIALEVPRRRFALAELVAKVAAALTRRRDRQMLARLDAHLLRDIGLTPDQADRECAKPCWRA
jgi:uncharacterized protein YjiS (DUF1127 family)